MPQRPQSGEISRLLSLDETSQILGCSLKTLRLRIKKGGLPVIRDGRIIRVHPDDLKRYIEQRRRG